MSESHDSNHDSRHDQGNGQSDHHHHDGGHQHDHAHDHAHGHERGHGHGHAHHHHEPKHPDSVDAPLSGIALEAAERIVYRFPPNQQAAASLDFRQIKKVQECAQKLEDAYSEDDTPRWMVEQAWDLIQAAEGVLRKHSDDEVLRGYCAVMQKCQRRGDFER